MSVNALLVALLTVLTLAEPLPSEERRYEKARVLQSAEFDECHHDCAPFDRPSYFYCFQIHDQVLIGSRQADWAWLPDINRMLQQAEQVSLRYDEHSIWVSQGGTKETRLKRDYSQDVFSDPTCTAAIHTRWLQEWNLIQRPTAVPSNAVLVPQGGRPVIPLIHRTGSYFWVRCKLNQEKSWDICQSWDEKGTPLSRLEGVNAETHTAVTDKELLIDPLTTKAYYEIHLQNGVVLKDWAKARVNHVPSADSIRPKPLAENSK